MLRLQGSVARLIYRYLAGGKQQDQWKTHLEEDDQKTPAEKADIDQMTLVEEDQRKAREMADRKTQLLLSLVQEIHICVHIMQLGARRPQQTSCPSPFTTIRRT